MGDQIVVPETRRYGIATTSAAAAGLGQFAINYGGQFAQQQVDRAVGAGIDYLRSRAGTSRFQTRLGPLGPMPVTGVKRKFGYGLVARTSAQKYGGSHTFSGKNKGKTSRVRVHKTCKSGYELEHEIKGSIRDPNTARLGITAYPVDQMLFAVWVAVLRYMLKKVANMEFYDVDQFIETNDVLTQVEIDYQTVTGKTTATSTVYPFSISSGTTTLRTLAQAVAKNDLLRRSGTSGTVLPYRIRITALGNPMFPPNFPTMQWYRIDKLVISLWGTAEINVQNVTSSEPGGNPNNTAALGNNVFNIPLTGNIVYGKGQTITANIRGRTNANTANDNDFPFAFEGHGNGAIVAGVGNNTTGTWRAVQPAGQFKYAKYQQSLNLNPGESKSMKLGYKWKGYLTSFLQAYFPESSPNDAIVDSGPVHQGSDDGKPGLNKWCLVQLEKRLDVFNNAPSFWYQVDHHLGARVVKGVRAENMNVDYGASVKSSVNS